MKTKVERIAKNSASNMSKRRGAPSDQEFSTSATASPVMKRKTSKKQAEQEISPKGCTSLKHDNVNGAIGKQLVRQQKNNAGNILPVAKTKENKDSRALGKQRVNSPSPVGKDKKCVTSPSSTEKPASQARKRLSPESNLSQSTQPKVQKLQTDEKRKEDENKKKSVRSNKNAKALQSKVRGENNAKDLKSSKKSVKGKSQPSDKTASHSKAVDASDPMAMLMMMEGSVGNLSEKSGSNFISSSLSPSPSLTKPSTSTPKEPLSKRSKKRQLPKVDADDSSGSEGLSDWEDVYEHPDVQEKSQVPDGPVEITLDLPDILMRKKRKKKEFDWKGYLERRVRRFKKEVAMDMHKVHLLCLLSLGMRQNEELNDLNLSGLLLSIMPSRLAGVVSDMGSSALERRVEMMLTWYKKTFSLEHIKLCTNIKLVLASAMEKCVSEGMIDDARVWVLVFTCILRTLGLSVRLVLSFHAMPYKVSQDKEKPGPSEKKHSKASGGPSKPQVKSSKSVSSTSSSKTTKTTSSKDKTQNSKTKTSGKKNESVVNRKRLSRASSETAKKNIRESCEDSEDSHSEDEDKVEGKTQKKTVVPTKEAKKSLKTKKKDDEDFHGSESEFEDTSSYFSSPRHLRKDLKILSNRKVLSASSSETEDVINRLTISGHDFWLELYFPEKRRWICFDAFKGQFGKPYSLENTATQPLTYVVAFKNDGGVKDVTARYAKLWMSHTRKQRADSEWWEESLAPFNTTPHSVNMEEDDEIKGQLLVRPMPTSIADLKNHPLYALRRHLLKFEAIYPDTAIPLGYIKQEPIYARECVQTLHSRDNWLKEGRMVRLGEQPYKMVKSRPKWNKPKDNPDELDLELYGEWQTEKYIPPPAVNGKVPKNEYGNLELFKPWMLPLGTVQLKVNGLQRIARKLGIDVAPAMIGWDHHSGHAHPVFDGVVVCEEHADTLMVAWTEDQEIQEQREIEKVEKRVYGNWRLLIRGLLIKNRLAEKFSQVDLNVKDKKERLLKRVQELKKQEEQEEELTFTNAEPALDVQHSWPRRQQDEVKDRKAKDTKLKIEEARNLLEKGYRTDKAFDTKDEIAVQTKESKGPAGKSSNGTLSNTVKHNGNRKSTSGTKAQIFKKEGVGKPSKGVKDGANAVKRKNTKSPTVHRGKRSEESETEEEFSDEDGQSKPVVKSKMTNRPKRRSVAAVKYFDSDEDGEQIIDDSDADSDFEQVKEKPRGSAKKVRTNDDEVDGAMDNVTSTSGSSKKKEPETDETRHWLDEEGSSSDENDFISVEPGDFSHSQIVQEKEILIDLDENKNLSAKLTTPGKETSVSDDKFEPSEGIFKNNIEMVSGVGNELSKASEALAVSEETCAQKASFNNTNRRKNKKQTHEDAFNTQTTSSNNSLISKKERDGGPKLPDKMNITENSKTSNTGTSKGRQQKSKDSTKSEEKVETKVNRKSMRITRQTS